MHCGDGGRASGPAAPSNAPGRVEVCHWAPRLPGRSAQEPLPLSLSVRSPVIFNAVGLPQQMATPRRAGCCPLPACQPICSPPLLCQCQETRFLKKAVVLPAQVSFPTISDNFCSAQDNLPPPIRRERSLEMGGLSLTLSTIKSQQRGPLPPTNGGCKDDCRQGFFPEGRRVV